MTIAALSGVASAVAQPPARVVSMNLCTDQLAMLLAAPGQLLSLSFYARDPRASAMAEEAEAYPINYGRAEELFLMRPDVVLAGEYSSGATVAMLRKLGVRVEQFAPASDFASIRSNIRRMGSVLGRDAEAEAMVAAFDARLDQIQAHTPGGEKPLAALYYANSFSAGAGSLADEIVRAAGFRNLGHELGMRGVAKLPLELLVMAKPDLVLGRDAWETAPALASEPLDHPAIAAISRGGVRGVESRYWLCGAPFTLEAVAEVAQMRAEIDAAKAGPLAQATPTDAAAGARR